MDSPSVAVPLKASTTPGWAAHLLSAALGLLAALWHATLMSSATNDNFLHMTLAQQWVAGDWPVRDFFEHAWVLQYALSAAAQWLGGERLLGEAIIVATAWGVSTVLVFHLVRRQTGYTVVAAIAGVLLIVASARGYSYPKGIVYAVAAVLWWQYVRRPTMARAVGFGAWAAIAFYWRPDHGVYVAIALALAVVTAHGLRWVAVTRCAAAAAVMLALVAPFLLYVQLTVGLPGYMQTAAVQAQVEHMSHGTHQWPVLRFRGHIVDVEPAEDYAPIVTIRWAQGSAPEERQRLLARYGLAVLSVEGSDLVRVRLGEQAIANTRGLINEPAIEDTAGIDRGSATVPASSWPATRRWAFEHPVLRIRVLPTLDRQARATEFAVALFHLAPLFLALGAVWIARRLPGPVTAPQLVSFAAFALLVDLAMLRDPFPARMPDAIVLSAIVVALCIAALWRGGASSGSLRGAILRTAALAMGFFVTASVAIGSGFPQRAAALEWRETFRELVASPPLRFYENRPARFTLRLASYVRECVPPSDRLLVLWFEPEIYYYSGRLMAQRHLGFAPAWSALAHEQRMTLEKVRRYAPPIALARRSAVDAYARATYPGIFHYLEAEYDRAAVVDDQGEEYWIFARRDRPAVGTFGPQGWPCYVRESGGRSNGLR